MKKIKYTSKSHPEKGVVASAFGLISLCSLIYAIKKSSDLSGNVGGTLALPVFLTFLMTVAGLALGVLSVLEPDAYKLFPVTGIVLCSLVMASMIVMMVL